LSGASSHDIAQERRRTGLLDVLSAAVIVLVVRGPVLIQVSGKGDNATGPMVVLTSLAVAWFVIV
jgi:hypothetical protein